MPSVGSQIALLGSVIATAGIVFYVHKSQLDDRIRVSCV